MTYSDIKKCRNRALRSLAFVIVVVAISMKISEFLVALMNSHFLDYLSLL